MKKKYSIFFIKLFTVTVIGYLVLMFSSNITIGVLTNYFMEHTKIQLFNFLFLFLMLLFFMSIFNSFWITSAFFITVNLIIAIINYEKVVYRNEGILPTDLTMINSIDKIFSMVNPVLIFMIIIFIALIFVLFYFLQRNYQMKFGKKFRILIILLSLFSIYGIINMHKEDSAFSKVSDLITNETMYYDPLMAVKINGPILNFANNYGVSIMDKPRGYSKRNISKIVNRYKKISKKLNKGRRSNNQKVVFILSESFSDPTKVPGIKLNKDPIPYTRSLIEHNVGGNMISDGYGGGTANMEYQSLTGLSLGNFAATLPTPYTQLVVNQKKTFTFNNLFDNSIAIHPYFGSLYSRKNVFKKMEFDKFYSLDNNYPKKYSNKIGENPYVSDKESYKYLISKLRGDNKSQFIQLSTMQNHMPFDKKYYKNNQFKVKGNVSKNESMMIENYSKGINYTDKANKYLLSRLKNVKQNITVVFYGDHLPSIYSHVNLRKNSVVMHETPYFIWSNHKKLRNIPYEQYAGTYSFGSEVMQATNSKVTPYGAMIQNISEKLPVIASKVSNTASDPNLPDGGMNLVDAKSRSILRISDMSFKQKKLLRDYQMIQYDLTAGKGYSEEMKFMSRKK